MLWDWLGNSLGWYHATFQSDTGGMNGLDIGAGRHGRGEWIRFKRKNWECYPQYLWVELGLRTRHSETIP